MNKIAAGGLSASRRGLLAALLLAAGSLVGVATAQTYPSQSVRVVVPFGAGGGVDIVARAIGNEWMQQFGHTIIVENRVGAGGNIGSAAAARSAGDGYTLLLASNSNSYNDLLFSNAGYDPVRDLVPVIQIGRVPIMLIASATIPARTVADVLAMAKTKPGGPNFASFGPGSSGHLLFEMFKRQSGANITHVPYRNGQTYPDLIAGRIQFIFANQLEATQYLRTGQVRAIGITGDQRSTEFPDVATFAEQGMPDMKAEVWWAVMAPAGTPPAVVARINEIVNKILASPDIKTRLSALGARPVGGTPQQFAAFFTSERSKWQRIIQQANIKID